MKDELKKCAWCGRMHRWGIIGRSQDNVPLYGPKPEGNCDNFYEVKEGEENLPAMTQQQTKELWAATEFLNPQVPTATRIAVAQLASLGKGERGVAKIAAQWTEFVSLMVSQLTDIRGAMTRDESKFAHLVAHTDDIVEAMRSVVQLKERLATQDEKLNRTLNEISMLRLDLILKDATVNDPEANAHFGLRPHRLQDLREWPKPADPETEEAARVFAEVSRPLWNEPIDVSAGED